jgi:hypothetical protein
MNRVSPLDLGMNREGVGREEIADISVIATKSRVIGNP